jgi:glycosyltransferase involved in cell wall biosynthesis
MMNDFAVCIVVSKNYISFARALTRAVRQHHAMVPVFVLLMDGIDGYFTRKGEPFEVIELSELEIPNLSRFCFQYDGFELSCATKPYLLLHLMQQRVARKLVYLDSDMTVVRELVEVPELLDRNSILLTPHLLHDTDDDGCKPGEPEILASGIYNAGFMAVRNDANAERFLSWLAQRLYTKCAFEVGLSCDQRWLDFVPGMFDGVHVFRHPGYNVGHWSLPHRTFERRGDAVLVNGQPLALFHFSGLGFDRLEQISKYQNRFTLSDLEALRPLFEDYRNEVMGAGYRETIDWPYAYGQFANGVPIPAEARRLYRSLGETVARFGNPFAAGGRDTFFAWLNEDVHSGSGISRLWDQLYKSRADVQRAFPDIFGADRQAFLAWVHSNGRKEFSVHEALCPEPVSAPAAVLIKTGVQRVSPVPPGVNIVGHAMSEKGVGEALRASVRSLNAATVPHVVIDFPDHGSANTDQTLHGFLDHNPYPVNLIHVNADILPSFLNAFGLSFLRGKYNIGFWVWELPEFPSIFHDNFAHLDEVWVPSGFCHDAVANASPVPVVKIPYSLPAGRLQTKGVGREYFGLPKDSCIFLFMFDVYSVLARKNPSGLIRAFKQAFGAGEDVRLVLKVVHADPAIRAAIADEAQDERILIIDQVLERAEVNSLIEVCDCYVSLHRSEGFGMTISESMALGKPVIATGYSGNTDFMTPCNSFPVGYDLVELDQDYGPYPRGSMWADPDVEHASHLMRLVYDDPKHARQVGERAARDIWQYLSPDAVGARIARRLELVAGRLDGHHRQNDQANTDGQRQKLLRHLTARGAVVRADARFARQAYHRARHLLGRWS